MIAMYLVLVVARMAVWQLVFKVAKKNVPIRVLQLAGQAVVAVVQALVVLLVNIVVVVTVPLNAVVVAIILVEMHAKRPVAMRVMENAQVYARIRVSFHLN